jgi:hypothetical protein
MDNVKNEKRVNEFNCKNCNFLCSKKYHYERHLATAKHKKITDEITNGNKKVHLQFICKCGKEYTNRHNLCRHKKGCDFKPVEEPIQTEMNIDFPINTNVIIDIIKENKEIKTILIEQNKQVIELHKENNILNKENNILNKENNKLINKLVEKESNTTINNNNTTNNNQSFNLNFFLNETCKDAMNMKDFIDNIKVTFEELLTIGNTGFVNGVSDIFIKRLKDMEVTKRPIHCTDLKRETIYLKEDNEWNKDENDNTKLKYAIEKVEYKNIHSLNEWCNENPDSRNLDTDNNQLWLKIYEKTLDGDEKTREKVIKNITKKITIDKESPMDKI